MQISTQDNRGIIGNGFNNFVNSGSITIGINDSEDELDILLRRHVSDDALSNSFYSLPECHLQTRITVRNEIDKWIDESEFVKSPLNGPAAVGKSVIAKTISGFHDQIVPLSSFPRALIKCSRAIPNSSLAVGLDNPRHKEAYHCPSLEMTLTISSISILTSFSRSIARKTDILLGCPISEGAPLKSNENNHGIIGGKMLIHTLKPLRDRNGHP